ncbi:MAG: uL22 family ribosomal protein [bacterium]
MQVKAKAKNLHETPRKLMLVAKTINGMDAVYAREWLKNANKRAAKTMYKLLNSAIANATNNYGLNAENLVISNAQVGVSHRRFKKATYSRTHVRLQVRKWAHAEITLDQKK